MVEGLSFHTCFEPQLAKGRLVLKKKIVVVHHFFKQFLTVLLSLDVGSHAQGCNENENWPHFEKNRALQIAKTDQKDF
jgi:hypothetical protein